MMAKERSPILLQVLIDQNRLAKAVQLVGRIVPKRPVTPVVSSVVLAASKDRLSVRATDLQTSADIVIEAQVHSAGELAVHGRVLSSIVASLSSEEVALSTSESGESLRLTAGQAAFRLRTLDVTDFPIPRDVQEWHAEITQERLVDLVARTTFCAVDSEELSPFVGVLVTAEDDRLAMAATDSYQLAHYRLPAHIASQNREVMNGVLPTSSLSLLARALDAFGDKSVKVAWGERSIAFQSETLSWQIRRLDVRYPDLSRFTGSLSGVGVTVEKERLLNGVRQVASIVEDGHRPIGLSLEDTRLHLFTSQQELGEAQVVIHLEESHPKREVWLDATRLTAALRAQPGSQVVLWISEPLAPVAIVPVESEGSYRTILMPVRQYAS